MGVDITYDLGPSRDEFHEVVKAYASGNDDVKSLAGLAHGYLGWISIAGGDVAGSVKHYECAVRLVEPHLRDNYNQQLREARTLTDQTSPTIATTITCPEVS